MATTGSGGASAILADLRAFHAAPVPSDPVEYRYAALLVKGLAYVTLACSFLAPVALGYAYLTGNALLAIAGLGVVPAFVLLAYAYPSFVEGERWSLFAISLVGAALMALAPARFLTEAASRQGVPAVPPTTTEWGVFFAAVAFLYIVLSPETRAGMHQARGEVARSRSEASHAHEEFEMVTVPVASATTRYVCPECGRVYRLRFAPAAGTPCPRCKGPEIRSSG